MNSFIRVAAAALATLIVLLGYVGDAAAQQATGVAIQNFAFSPQSVTVPVGATVTWTNHDNTAHTVTGNSAGGPSSGMIQPGQKYSFTFTKAGSFPYHCSIHTYMTGTVTVGSSSANTPAPVVTTPPASVMPGMGGGTSSQSMPMPTNSSPAQTNSNLPDTGSNDLLGIAVVLIAVGGATFYAYLRKKKRT